MESIKELGRLLLRRAEAQRLLGIGPSKYKQIVADGGIREVAIGQRGRRVSYAELERFVADRMAKQEPAECTALEITSRDLTKTLIALFRDRRRWLRADAEALAWGGLSREAALDVLGDDATLEAIDALVDAGRSHS